MYDLPLDPTAKARPASIQPRANATTSAPSNQAPAPAATTGTVPPKPAWMTQVEELTKAMNADRVRSEETRSAADKRFVEMQAGLDTQGTLFTQALDQMRKDHSDAAAAQTRIVNRADHSAGGPPCL